MNPLPAGKALDAYFHEARSKLLDVAAILDRIDRGQDASAAAKDPRLAKLRQALNALLEMGDARAERVQEIFSLEYDPDWEKPELRS